MPLVLPEAPSGEKKERDMVCMSERVPTVTSRVKGGVTIINLRVLESACRARAITTGRKERLEPHSSSSVPVSPRRPPAWLQSARPTLRHALASRSENLMAIVRVDLARSMPLRRSMYFTSRPHRGSPQGSKSQRALVVSAHNWKAIIGSRATRG